MVILQMDGQKQENAWSGKMRKNKAIMGKFVKYTELVKAWRRYSFYEQ